ncbi:substrate-binding domain-containing protein [Sciscionella sediminilitoris]|uniref:substrate-binding domain-containing protein n=1 Tax=Sciscionella sediminilitoris TaxID=1445613 RepID=UPI0018D1B67B|nr:substrate-binding domain-containing protein [Sciscionella sp. SE31]
MALGLALLAAGCTAVPREEGPVTAELGDRLAPSVYCGTECRSQLALHADPSTVHCSVGVSWNSTAFPYGARTTGMFPEFARKFLPGMKVTVADAQGDAGAQVSQVSDMLAKGVKVLVISPQDAAALRGVVAQATRSGVKVITADRQVDGNVSSYIGSDNVEAGVTDGKAVVKALGGRGSVVELSGSLGASPTITRGSGFRKGIAGSGLRIIATQTANYKRADGLQVMEDMLQRFGRGQIQAVYSHNDQMTFGALQAIREAGRQNEIKVFSVDGEAEALHRISAGPLTATVGYPLVAKEAAIAAAKLCAGEPLAPRIKLESTLIDRDNVGQFLDRPPQ